MSECVIGPYHNLCHTQKFSIKNSTFAWLLIHILITLQRLLIMNRSLNLIYICARWLRDSSLMSLEKYFCSTSKYSHNIAKKMKLIPAWMTKKQKTWPTHGFQEFSKYLKISHVTSSDFFVGNYLNSFSIFTFQIACRLQ